LRLCACAVFAGIVMVKLAVDVADAVVDALPAGALAGRTACEQP
jgi:hypothetical protein